MPTSYVTGDTSSGSSTSRSGPAATPAPGTSSAPRLRCCERVRLGALEGLRAEIRKGLDSGSAKAPDEVLAHLERKYLAM